MPFDRNMKPLTPESLSGSRFYWAWTTIIVGIGLSVLDGTIANVALPTIAEVFHAEPAFSVWIVNGYQLAIVMTLLPLAALGEIYGFRPIYLAGITLFTLASLACSLSNSLTVLTAVRVIQGIGAAGMMSVNTALLRYIVPERKLGAAIGLNAIVVAGAATVGPTLAGLILSRLSWPWLFSINVPLGLFAVVVGWRSLPNSDQVKRPFDVVSALLTALMFGSVIITIDSIGHQAAMPTIVGELAVCLIATTMLIRRERKASQPMLPLDLLALPIFSMSVATSVASFSAQTLAMTALPFELQSNFGFSPLEVGLLLMPWPLAVAVAAVVSGQLSDRFSPAVLGGVGLLCLAAGLFLMATLPEHPQTTDIIWRMTICGAGFGLFQSPNNRTLITSAPRPRSGAASGMLGISRLTGQSIGAALVALLLARLGMVGANTSLFLGAAFALVASILSLARFRSFKAAA